MGAKDLTAASERASRIRALVAAKGFTIAEFGRVAGFTRNRNYAIFKGSKMRPDEALRAEKLLGSQAGSLAEH